VCQGFLKKREGKKQVQSSLFKVQSFEGSYQEKKQKIGNWLTEDLSKVLGSIVNIFTGSPRSRG